MLPEGTVTLLLADLESSTDLWQHDGSKALEAQAALDVLVAGAVAANDGVLPTVQGEGDSFVAAFTRPSLAVACALEIQQHSADAPLRFRMGVHTGEVVVREDRYAGTTIIRTARVRDLGHGGQILVTSATRDLVLDVLPPGCDLVDLGEHPLKGLDRPERVHQLTHPSLRVTFPALRSRATRAALPARLTSFIGRTVEMHDVLALIGTARLVTLTGAGGCGKTRLAVEAASQLDADVWFCDLAPLADPDLVAPALCSTLGAGTEVHATPIAVACDHLASSDAVVVLDNCEHLIDECATVVEALLRCCPRVRIVATSREPLGVVGEVPWRVPSLPAPRLGESAAPDEVASFAAVTLFVDRAATVRPGFALTEQNARPIAAICARLDGIPLAIELAAARVRVLSPREISEGLNDRFRLLGRGARTLLPRQQTLEASVAWSYDLLTPEQRAVLRRASMFAGGFTLEAAEQIAVGDGVEQAEVLELLTQLVDRSLVVVDESPHGVRYRMLETIRLYARERLVDAGEANDLALRHLRWFESWVRREVRLALGGGDTTTLFDRFEDDFDNVRAATEWAIAADESVSGVRLVAPLANFLGTRTIATRFEEVAGWLKQLLAHDALDDRTRIEGLIALHFASGMISDWSVVVPTADEAVALARGIEAPSLLGRALWCQGVAHIGFDPQRGVSILEEALAIALEAEDPVTASFAVGHLCQTVTIWLADPGRGLELAKQLPDGTTREFYDGMNLLMMGRLDEATPYIERAASAWREVQNTYWATIADGELASVALARGDLDEARRLSIGALALGQGAGVQTFMAWASLIDAQSIAGDAGSALREHQRFVDSVDPSIRELPIGAYFIETSEARIRGRAALRSGDADEVRRVIADLDRWRADPTGPPMHRPIGALLERSVGEHARAEACIIDELAERARTKAYLFAPDALDIRAALHADVGADEDAIRLLAAAASARAEQGSVGSYRDVLDVDALIDELRARVDVPRFDAAWEAGSSLSLEDALALSIRGRGSRQRPQSGWDAITPMERQVIDLIIEGLTNPQIAERLFISKRTVSTHLSHVFAKVGVKSRAELAAAAATRRDR